MLHSNAPRNIKTKLLLLFFIPFNIIVCPAQILKKIKQTIDEGTSLMGSIAKLTDATKRTSAEFGKNVTVAKGNTGNAAPTPPSDTKTTKPIIKNDKFTNLSWEPVNYFDGQLFPSAIISMATYRGELKGELEAISRPIGFRIISNNAYIPLRWEIESVDKRYFDKIDGNFMYEQPGREVYLMPEIPWNYEMLAKTNTSSPLNIYFRLYDEQGKKVEKLVPLFLRSVNDCIYYYKDINMQFMFSAFVQEEHPEIDKILREALNTKMINRWVGYQNSGKEVDLQLAAIWRVLHDRGFAYSSITGTTGDQGNVHSQAVRTFDNSLKTSQANCVDGTVVFASILKKIGIDPIMVLVPGHCFLGYYTDDKKTNFKFLETTMLSREGDLPKAKTAADKSKAYINLFLDAQDYAMKEYLDYKKAGSANLISISEYRKYIKPIPVYN
jgi:hypothetical protein